MSCQTIHTRDNIDYENGPFGNSIGSFAPLDTAFNYSAPMAEFQNKLINQNPLLIKNDNIIPESETKITISPQSEEKINNNVDEIINSYYNRDKDIGNLTSFATNKQYVYPNIPVVQNGIRFPLTRNQHYSLDKHGSELLEDFNLGQDAQDIWDNTNTTSYSITGMSFFKFILLLILIAILVYAIYWLYKTGSLSKDITNTNTATKTILSPSTKMNSSSKIEKLLRL